MTLENASNCYGAEVQEDSGRIKLLESAASLTLSDIVTQGVNYGIQIGLARYFTPAEYGRFGIIASILVLMEVVLRWGLPRAISYFVAQDRRTARATLRKWIGLQTIFGLLCFLIFFLFADRLALALGDVALADYLYFCAPFMISSALVPVYTGVLHGLGAFNQLAGIRAISHLVKLLLVLALLYVGTGIYGVIAAYTLSPWVILVYGFFFVRAHSWPSRNSVDASNIFRFGVPLFVAALAISLLMRIDLLMVQSILADNIGTGMYAAVSSLLRGPVFLAVAAAALFFRVIAQLKAESISKAQEFVSRISRYYVLAIVPIPFILCATAEETVVMVFGVDYAKAVPTFEVLSFCFAFMVFYNMFTTFITALAGAQYAMVLALALIPVQVLLIYMGIFAYGLVGVALASTLTWGIGTVMGLIYLLREGCVSLPSSITAMRVMLAAISSYCIAVWISPKGLWLLLFYPSAYLGYLISLRLTGEVTSQEITPLRLALRSMKRRML